MIPAGSNASHFSVPASVPRGGVLLEHPLPPGWFLLNVSPAKRRPAAWTWTGRP